MSKGLSFAFSLVFCLFLAFLGDRSSEGKESYENVSAVSPVHASCCLQCFYGDGC